MSKKAFKKLVQDFSAHPDIILGLTMNNGSRLTMRGFSVVGSKVTDQSGLSAGISDIDFLELRRAR